MLTEKEIQKSLELLEQQQPFISEEAYQQIKKTLNLMLKYWNGETV